MLIWGSGSFTRPPFFCRFPSRLRLVSVPKIIRLEVDAETFAGVDAISLVEFPAIEQDFQVFSKAGKVQKYELAKLIEEKRLVVGPVMIPNKMIFRVNPETGEEFYVYFDKGTVRKAAYEYLKANKQHSATVEHEVAVNGVTLVESWIIEGKQDKARHLGYELPEGTWMASLQVNNDAVWELAKKKTVKGFSIEGWFNEALNKHNMNLLSKIKTALKGVKMATAVLTDGQTVTNGTEEPMKVGDSAFVVTPEGEQLPLPDGSYDLEDGTMFTVVSGVIDTLEVAETEELKEDGKEDMATALEAALAPILARLEALEASKQDVEASVVEVAQSVAKLSQEPEAEPVRRVVAASRHKSEPEKKGPYSVQNTVRQIVETYR